MRINTQEQLKQLLEQVQFLGNKLGNKKQTEPEAFAELKNKLITVPVLAFPDFTLPFELEINSSLKRPGAVLSQRKAHGKVVMATREENERL